MRINLDVVPATLDQAVELFLAGLDADERETLRLMEDASLLHMGVGMWLRNNWSLWEAETKLCAWFREHLGIWHADDMSGIILESARRKLRGEPVEAEEQAKHYLDYWAGYKIKGYDDSMPEEPDGGFDDQEDE